MIFFFYLKKKRYRWYNYLSILYYFKTFIILIFEKSIVGFHILLDVAMHVKNHIRMLFIIWTINSCFLYNLEVKKKKKSFKFYIF